jgi:hypothetical protein
MPDTVPLLVGLIAGVAGALVTTRPNKWLGPTEAAVATLAVVGWAADVLSPLAVAAIAVPLAVGKWPGVDTAPALLISAGLVMLDTPSAAEDWLGVTAAAAVIVIGLLTRPATTLYGSRATLAMVASMAAVAYLAVPDTEEVTAVAAALGIVAAATALAGIRPKASAVDAAVVATVWAVMTGARGREASVVVLAAAMLLLIAPLAWLGVKRVQWRTPTGTILALLHLAGGVAVARYAGLGSDVSESVIRAVLVTVPVTLLGAILLVVGGVKSRDSESGG